MNRIDNATLAHNMKWGMILVVGLLLSLILGTTLAANSMKGVITFFAIVLPLAWIMIGSRYWWLPIPFGLAIGGAFSFGFKILPHEVGLALALASLATALPLRWKEMIKHRNPINLSILALCAYLVLHWAGSLLFNKYAGIGGAGNVSRAYMSALWPIIFLLVFQLFGSSSQLRIALYMILIIAVVRAMLGYVAYVFNVELYIPVINYVPAPFVGAVEIGNTDFRVSGLLLGSCSMMISLLSTKRPWKFFWLGGFIFGALTLLLGGGRGAFVTFLVFPLMLIVLYRKWLTLCLIGAGFAFLTGVINIFPTILDEVPYFVSRSLSIFVLDKGNNDFYGDISSSDNFHDSIIAEGVKRWTSNWHTLTFGTGIRPFNRDLYEASSWDPEIFGEEILQNAANTGNYEAGFWDVLAVTGLVGLALYLNAFRFFIFYLAKSVWKNKICDAGHAFAFLGLAQLVSWLLLAWKSNTWPSEAIFYAYLGYVWIQDQEARAKEEAREQKKLPQGQREAQAPAAVGAPTSGLSGRGPNYGGEDPAFS